MLSDQNSFAESGSSPQTIVTGLRITPTPDSAVAICRGRGSKHRACFHANHRPALTQVDRRIIDGELT